MNDTPQRQYQQPNRRPEVLRVTKTIQPGQAGSLKLLRRYGNALVCVRYREDTASQARYTTVELVVDRSLIQHRPATQVCVCLPWNDSDLRQKAMAQGATWDPATRLWTMPYAAIAALELANQIHSKYPDAHANPRAKP